MNRLGRDNHMQRQEYFSKAGLKSRGWTETLIGQVLGNHDKEAENPRHGRGPTMKLFLRERVERAERTEPRAMAAVGRNPEKLAEHQALVEKRDRRFSWTVPVSRWGFTLYLWYGGETQVDVSVRVFRTMAKVSVNDEAFTLLARSAFEVGEAAPVVDWLLEYGEPTFRDVLSRCMGGEAGQIVKEREEKTLEAKQKRQEKKQELARLKKERTFVKEGKLGDFTIAAVYEGAGAVTIEIMDSRARGVEVSFGNAECVRLAGECDRNPGALLDWMADRYVGNERLRAALACCRWGDEAGRAWWERVNGDRT